MSTTSPSPRRPRDPGLQPERTALAWNRTALAVAVNGALVMRAGLVGNVMMLLAVGALLLVAAAAATAYSTVRKRQLVHESDVPHTSNTLALVLTAAVTCAACLAGIASILVLG